MKLTKLKRSLYMASVSMFAM